MRKHFLLLLCCTLLLFVVNPVRAEEPVITTPEQRVVVAYVTSWSTVIPDPFCMTHINYAFGHVNKRFKGIRIDNKKRLKKIAALKKENSELKVLISLGGWGSGGFSEMAANEKWRRSFAKSCRKVIKRYRLDGVDIDWEYPTSAAAKISASPDDTKNFTLLMKDIREAIGDEKLLTLATVANARYIDFKDILPYIDFVNIMAYDMGVAPKHHSALYRSENAGDVTGDEAVTAHLEAGVPASKLVMGMPFYGRGGGKGFPRFRNFNKVGYSDEYTECWDEVAQVPYLINKDGLLVYGFENVRSFLVKCQYIKERNLLGAMYWEYAGDTEAGDLRTTLYENLIKK